MTLLYAFSAYLTLGLLLALAMIATLLTMPAPTSPQEAENEDKVKGMVEVLRPRLGDAWPLAVIALIALAWPWVVWCVLLAVARHLAGRPGRHRA